MTYSRDGKGFQSEELIQELLEVTGWHVVNTRKAADDGRAPLSHAEDENIRLPDFLAHHPDHSSRYVEVKAKAKPREFRKENSVRHGWEKPQHEDYLRFDEVVDAPVYIFVHETEPGIIRRQRVRDLSVVQEITDTDILRQYYDTTDHMVLFEVEQFDDVTRDVSGLSAGFGQSGLVDESVELQPFGLSHGGEQFDLKQFGGESDE